MIAQGMFLHDESIFISVIQVSSTISRNAPSLIIFSIFKKPIFHFIFPYYRTHIQQASVLSFLLSLSKNSMF